MLLEIVVMWACDSTGVARVELRLQSNRHEKFESTDIEKGISLI